MSAVRRTRALRAALSSTVAAGALFGCIDRPVSPVTPITQSGVSEVINNDAIDKVDLLMMVDNSGSMKDNQRNIMSQFANLINKLTDPPCISSLAADPSTAPTIPCRDAGGTPNPDAVPKYRAVKDLRVGVVSSDLGTQGFTVPGCLNPMSGDDGLLNPIANGGALAYHLPWMPTQSGASAAPAGFRPDGCTTRDQFPRWISFVSGNNTDSFARDFRCNAGLYINGCGLESQLEAVWRALIWNGASLPDGTADKPNAGFLREDAILAIVELTDEEDGSVQNCQYAANPNNPSDMVDCDPTKGDVYRVQSTDWSSAMDPNLRFYTYPQAGGTQDPTWNLNRYIDPANIDRGFLSLKPGHPERVLFAAITGVPLDLPMTSEPTPRVDWNQLLGQEGPGGPNDFYGRVNDGDGAALTAMSPEGRISMRLDNPDPTCSTRVVPSCYARGTQPTAGCPGSGGQYYAWPARRVVEVARRFDQLACPSSQDGKCHNGLVTSICSTDYTQAVDQIVERIQSQLVGRCLPRHLDSEYLTYKSPAIEGSTELGSVQCDVRELLAERNANDPIPECDPTAGRSPPTLTQGSPYQRVDGSSCTPEVAAQSPSCRTVCIISQVPFYPPAGSGLPVPTGHNAGEAAVRFADAGGEHDGVGWFYDTTVDPTDRNCTQRIAFTNAAQPQPGSITRLECIQNVSGDPTTTGH